jgi:hypothetical protein
MAYRGNNARHLKKVLGLESLRVLFYVLGNSTEWCVLFRFLMILAVPIGVTFFYTNPEVMKKLLIDYEFVKIRPTDTVYTIDDYFKMAADDKKAREAAASANGSAKK